MAVEEEMVIQTVAMSPSGTLAVLDAVSNTRVPTADGRRQIKFDSYTHDNNDPLSPLF